MKKRSTANTNNEIRVELKYCERCGSLGVRDCDGTQVYCNDCLPKLAELPAPRRARSSPQLPIGRRAFIDDELDFIDLDELDLEAAGGVA